ncbi:hypothetical protein A6K25_15660 [Alteromonas stellipolaris]|uniref:hypothetical protein n=1 Tax=Alteromonas stellipolaris TaxID=233316 RepID=UPI0007B45165|nr:hypothetical protein [Alteromonas stellipolaris]ANB22578.1 hypothetical protein A6K25_15660 [Alteromonas stellipolaris]
MKWLLPISLLALYGCGGSTGDSNTTTPTPSSPPNLTIQGASEIIAGDSADFAVAAPSGTFITSVNWTVSATSASTQANNITPLASHTQAIGFDAMAAGEYLVSVTATFSSADTLTDETLTDELSFTVIEGQPLKLFYV